MGGVPAARPDLCHQKEHRHGNAPALRTDPAPRSATGAVARITDGEHARAFWTMDITGNVVDLSEFAGRHILVSFFRFASCPFCNLRVHGMIERYPAYHDAGMAMIAVFESPRETMLRYVAGRMDAPFPLIADPEDHLYRLYGLETSCGLPHRAGYDRPSGLIRHVSGRSPPI